MQLVRATFYFLPLPIFTAGFVTTFAGCATLATTGLASSDGPRIGERDGDRASAHLDHEDLPA
jgi:hypothetical protein